MLRSMVWNDVLLVDWLDERFYYVHATSPASTWLATENLWMVDPITYPPVDDALRAWAMDSPFEAKQLLAALAVDMGGLTPHAVHEHEVPRLLSQALRWGALWSMVSRFAPAHGTLAPFASAQRLSHLEFAPSHHPAFSESRPDAHPAFSENRPDAHPAFSESRPDAHPAFSENRPDAHPAFSENRPDAHPAFSENRPPRR